MQLHGNARTTPYQRREIARRVLEQAEPAKDTALALGVSERTIYKWLRRYREEGEAGLQDRCSRPRQCPNQTPPAVVYRILRLRRRRLTAWDIAQRLQIPRSTVSRVLCRHGLSRLHMLEPKPPVVRYERKRPGELLHLDTKKLARIVRPGHRIHGDRSRKADGAGWENAHVAVDDHSRLAYVEVLHNEGKLTCTDFLIRAVQFYRKHGVVIERVMTDTSPGKGIESSDLLGPVLVVGGAGYIGSHTVRALEARGLSVVVLDDYSTGHPEAVSAPVVRTSLSDRGALAEAFAEWKPRSVMHFAARCYVGESVTDPSTYYRENVINAWNLLEAMRDADCRELVFSSTCATYGVPVAIPLTEENPQVPINPYGRTKLHMEHMMEDYSNAYGLRYAALRYFNAAGASPAGDLGEHHDPESHLIPLVLQVALGQRDEIAILGDDYPTPDGTCVRDYIHIVDLADAHLRALSRLQDGTQTLACNLGTGQ
ncbi:MAG: UDP-glucose 4-epimerase GalE, partial [Myxococcota bacterium]|nr:UDP-glucose 4-epimerase GalE [Myxococcota bacterium]